MEKKLNVVLFFCFASLQFFIFSLNVVCAGVLSTPVRNFDVNRSSGCIFVLFDGDIFQKSCNRGATWQNIQAPPNASSSTFDLKTDTTTNKIFAFDGYSIYSSDQNTMSWVKVPLPSGVIRFGGYKYADTANGKLFIFSENKIYTLSTTGNWSAISNFPSNIYYEYWEFWEITDSGDIYIGSYNPSNIYKSSDNGQTWNSTGWTSWSSPACIESFQNIVFSGSYVDGIRQKTVSSWEKITKPPFPEGWGSFTLGIINNNVIYTQPGVLGSGDIEAFPPYRTLNGGETWEKIEAGLNYRNVDPYSLGGVLNIGILASDNGYAYALVNDGSLYVTHHSEKFWRPIVNMAKPLCETIQAEKNNNDTVKLNGKVYPNGLETEISFEYGSTESLGDTVILGKITDMYGEREVGVEVPMNGGKNKIFHRIIAKNMHGTSRGAIIQSSISSNSLSGIIQLLLDE